MTLRTAANLQCQGCREDWPIHERTPALPGGAELYHKPGPGQSHTWVAWPMDCEAWRIRKTGEKE